MNSLDHIGVAVEDLARSIEEYQSKFGCSLEYREVVEEQGVEVAFLATRASRIELIMSIDDDKPFAKSVAKRGYGLHHIAFVVEDIAGELARLEGLGCKLIDRAPRRGPKGKWIAFVDPSSLGGVLSELVQY